MQKVGHRAVHEHAMLGFITARKVVDMVVLFILDSYNRELFLPFQYTIFSVNNYLCCLIMS
jgi:hypothetical protein